MQLELGSETGYRALNPRARIEPFYAGMESKNLREGTNAVGDLPVPALTATLE